jgi:hypothetical protein
MKEIFHDNYYNHKKIQALYNYMIRTEYVYNKEKLTVNQTIKKYDLDENEIKKIFTEKLSSQLRHKFDEDINTMVDKLYEYHLHKYDLLLPRISYIGEFYIPILVINVTHLYEEVMSKFIVDEKTGKEVLLKEYINTPRLSIDEKQDKIINYQDKLRDAKQNALDKIVLEGVDVETAMAELNKIK